MRPSLSLVSTPPLIQLLLLPVVDQAFTILNISITNVKNSLMLFTLDCLNTKVTSKQLPYSCDRSFSENCNHTGHKCEKIPKASFSSSASPQFLSLDRPTNWPIKKAFMGARCWFSWLRSMTTLPLGKPQVQFHLSSQRCWARPTVNVMSRSNLTVNY